MTRLRSVRARTTLAATLVVGVALVAGAVIVVTVLRRSLVASIDEGTRLRAASIASLLRVGAMPTPLPGASDDTALIQVVGPSGALVAASGNIEGEPPLRIAPSPRDGLSTVSRLPIGEGEDFRLLSLPVTTPAGTSTIYVASSLDAAQHAVAIVAWALAVGIPALLGVVAASTWMTAGRALSPVEAIRAEVAEISTLALDRLVSEPAVADEVGRLARTMNEMLDRLRSSARRQRQFVSDASHELRSPMAGIRAQLEVALARPETADWHTTASEVLAEVGRLQRLVDQLLTLARVDEAALVLSDKPVDLDELVLQEARKAREREGLAVGMRDVSAARVRGDPDWLRQVVCNLMDNARRHARATITLGLREEGTNAVLFVADDGPGIDVADRERVFERFARLDEARAAGDGGAGLGLAIAREIVVAHGGTIIVEEAPVGARLVARLPLDRP